MRLRLTGLRAGLAKSLRGSGRINIAGAKEDMLEHLVNCILDVHWGRFGVKVMTMKMPRVLTLD